MNEKRKCKNKKFPAKNLPAVHRIKGVTERGGVTMANYDKQMADRVWKRVQGEREEEKRDLNLKGLILSAQMASATYQQLSRQLGQREGPTLQRLAREEQANSACLKGICLLAEGRRPDGKQPQITRESPELMLRRAYAGELKTMAALEALSGHPEYGHIFADLAARERDHSRTILEILGRLERTK